MRSADALAKIYPQLAFLCHKNCIFIRRRSKTLNNKPRFLAVILRYHSLKSDHNYYSVAVTKVVDITVTLGASPRAGTASLLKNRRYNWKKWKTNKLSFHFANPQYSTGCWHFQRAYCRVDCGFQVTVITAVMKRWINSSTEAV